MLTRYKGQLQTQGLGLMPRKTLIVIHNINNL
jgi:hypothetical protein